MKKITIHTVRQIDDRDLEVFLGDLKLSLFWIDKDKLVENGAKQEYTSGVIMLNGRVSSATTTVEIEDL